MIKVWPVIHVRDTQQALDNARIASRVGAHGVFLIQMEGNDSLLDPIAEKIRNMGLGLRLGVNYLSLDAASALSRAISQGYDASWSDGPGVRSDLVNQTAHSCSSIIATAPKHRFFASVAFKYQQYDPHPSMAALRAHELGFTATTSGSETGVAPSISKIEQIYRILSKHPQARLALASGADPDNIADFSQYLTDVLVSTGVSSDFYSFSEELLSRFINRAALT